MKIEEGKIYTFRLREDKRCGFGYSPVVGEIDDTEVILIYLNKDDKNLDEILDGDTSLEFVTGKVSKLSKDEYYEIHLYDDENFRMF